MKNGGSVGADVLRELVERIVDAVHPTSIVLFGSAARDPVGPGSDLDVLVVMPEGVHRRRTGQTLHRALAGLGVPEDVVVVTEKDIEEHGENPSLVLYPALREGKQLHRAGGREVKLPEYLEKVWEVVGRTALEHVFGSGSSFQPDRMELTGKTPVPHGAFEEDARFTALFLWTLQSTGDAAGDGEGAAGAGAGEEEDTGRDAGATRKTRGFSLVFDVVRRFAQPLGIELPRWEGRIIETRKGVVRLMAVSEREGELFGEDGAASMAGWIEREASRSPRKLLCPEAEEKRAPRARGRKPITGVEQASSLSEAEMTARVALPQATTLDRVHAAMRLQAGGQTNALRALVRAARDRGPDFERLANALSALYPRGTEEKRLVEAMLLAMPR